jgi:GntR family transcriptional regulator
MQLKLNFNSGLPVYLQIVEQVKAASASGSLRPGDPLPSIRPMAEQLRVNRNTVAKAYTELESQGIIQTIPGKGCFVSENNSPLKKEARRKLLIEGIDPVVVQAHHLQVPMPELVDLVSERAQIFEEQKTKNNQPT